MLLANFFDSLDKFNYLKIQKEKVEKKIANVYNTASELYNNLLGIYLMNTMRYQMLQGKI